MAQVMTVESTSDANARIGGICAMAPESAASRTPQLILRVSTAVC